MRRASKNGTTSVLILLALSVPAAALAQGGARDRTRDRPADQTAIRDRAADRTADQDRLTDRDRIEDRDQDRTLNGDRDRTRQPLYLQDRQQLRDRDIYGSQLMTRKELREYRRQLATINTVREWAHLQAQHQEQMMARARERGVQLPAPLYGQPLMTHLERQQLQARLQNAANEQERERIRNEHREQMQERAREYQIPLNELGEG